MAEQLSVVMPVYNERYLVRVAIERVLRVESPLISRLELIVVDDGSTDGTREVLRELAREREGAFRYLEHDRNLGKGAAVRTGIDQATGTVTVIQDADLEYDPQDLPRLLVPFIEHGADAVYGSRFLTSDYRRVLYFRHSLGNAFLTFLASLITDLNLSDMETCYKAVRTDLLKSIPIRSPDFRLEPELTIKLAKRGARLFEVPISYAGRTYTEGKKIGFRDGFLAVVAMLHWWLIDDLYRPDEYGSNILVDLASTPNFNRWMADTLRPFVGARVLEVGAGIGNLSRQFLPRERYTATDVNPHYLHYLDNQAEGRPYMDVQRFDLSNPAEARHLGGGYDTVLCVNVLEHVADENQALTNLRTVLAPDGRAVVLVPQNQKLYGTLDEALEHVKRYSRRELKEALEKNGFEVERILDFNRVTTPAWWVNGILLRRRHFSRLQLKIVNQLTWLFRLLERVLPWHGASLIAVARRTPELEGGSAPRSH
jgi:glycosyltransferase involved in cell wall biosynthesis